MWLTELKLLPSVQPRKNYLEKLREEMAICKNCNHEVSENYCPNCGQSAHLKRINGKYIIHEIEHVLHFEKGILYTIRELLIRPGESIRNFVSTDRNRLVKPIIFIIVSSLIYTILTQIFKVDDGYVKFSEAKPSSTGVMLNWVKTHYGYANIIMAIFIAFWLKIFFRKYNYNFYEILILLCFTMGMGMLFFGVFTIMQVAIKFDIQQIGSAIAILYISWGIGQFFDKKKKINYLKALFAYILGMITFFGGISATGYLIDNIIKN